MKQLLPLFLFLLPCLAWAQYPSNGNQKITLGEQTTADGLIYRGVLADTGIITPLSDTSAYIILDTVNHRFYNYNRATNVWSVAGGVTTFSAGTTGLTPNTATSGAVTLGGTLAVANGGTGASSFSPNNYLIRTNSSGIFDTSLVYEANGRVGIGTTNPLNNFQIGTAFPINFNANYPQIQFNSYLESGEYKVASSGFGSTIYLHGGNGNLIYTSGDSTSANSTYTATTKFVINKFGNIGLGTESPNFNDFSSNSRGIQITNQIENFAGIRLTGNTLFTTGSLGIYSGGAIHYFWGSGANPMVFATDGQPRMRITSGGDVGIGTADPAVQFHTTSNVRFAGLVNYDPVETDADGDIIDGGASDFNLKNSIEPINYGLNSINQLKPVSYLWNDVNRKLDSTIPDIGFIAQDVMDVIPEAVRSNGDGDLQLNYKAITATLVKAIQEQNALIKALEQRIINLENK